MREQWGLFEKFEFFSLPRRGPLKVARNFASKADQTNERSSDNMELGLLWRQPEIFHYIKSWQKIRRHAPWDLGITCSDIKHFNMPPY